MHITNEIMHRQFRALRAIDLVAHVTGYLREQLQVVELFCSDPLGDNAALRSGLINIGDYTLGCDPEIVKTIGEKLVDLMYGVYPYEINDHHRSIYPADFPREKILAIQLVYVSPGTDISTITLTYLRHPAEHDFTFPSTL